MRPSKRCGTMKSEPLDGGVAARGAQARENLVSALRDCCVMADAVESFEGADLLETLVAIDTLRFVMAESSQLLQGVVRGFEEPRAS